MKPQLLPVPRSLWLQVIGVALIASAAISGSTAHGVMRPLAFQTDDIVVSNTMTVGGSTTFNGAVAFSTPQTFSTTGVTLNVPLDPTTTILKYTGGGTATWSGFTGGVQGRRLCVINTTGSGISLVYLDAAATAGNRIVLASALDGSIKNRNVQCFIWDSTLDTGNGGWQQEQDSYISVLSGERINLITAQSTANQITATWTPVAGTSNGVASIDGVSNGTFDTTAGQLIAYGLLGNSSATRSAGANNLINVGVRGFAGGAAQDNRGAWGITTGTGTTNYGLRAEATGAGTTNIAGYFTATSAATNNAIQADAGHVLLNNTGVGDTKINARVIRTGTPGVNHGTLGTGSTDWIGNVTGIGAFTSVVLTYSAAFPTRSWCTITPNTSATVQVYVVTQSASAPTVNCFLSSTGAASNCQDFTWNCVGQ